MKKIILAAALALTMAIFATGCLVGTETEETATDETETVIGETSEEVTETTEDDSEETEGESEDYGAVGALSGSEYTLEEMLLYAIEDEYLARQEYESIMEEYGEQSPFSNIIEAEEYHIELLIGLYEKYGLDIPEDNAIDYVVLPESLAVAYDLGVTAEINNIAMYELFLSQDLPDDVEQVFIELRDASENHLAAFEKGVRGNGNGNGRN